MRPITILACLVLTVAFASVMVATPAWAGPGVGGGYEKTPPKKAKRRKTSEAVANQASA